MNGDINSNSLLTFSPSVSPHSILKETCGENLMLLQTPIHKNLKVSFQTPARTPLGNITGNVIQTKPSNSKFIQELEKWNELRHLDDELNWKDRIEVITKYDHEDYKQFAREILDSIIDNVVQSDRSNVCGLSANKLQSTINEPENEKENLKSDFQTSEPKQHISLSDGIDTPESTSTIIFQKQCMENSNFDDIFENKKNVRKEGSLFCDKEAVLPSYLNNDIETENKFEDLGEFQDATALISTGFNFDCLETKGSMLTESEFRKQSLFLKFDPMFANCNNSPPLRFGRKSDILDLCGLAVLPESTHVEHIPPEPKQTPDYLCGSPNEFTEAKSEVPSHNGVVDEIIQVLEYSAQDLDKLICDTKFPLENEIESINMKLKIETKKNQLLENCNRTSEETNAEIKKQHSVKITEVTEKNDRLNTDNEMVTKQNLGMAKLIKDLLKQSADMKISIEKYKNDEIVNCKEANELKLQLIEVTQQNEKLMKSVDEQCLKYNSKVQEEQLQQEIKKEFGDILCRSKLLEIENDSLKSQIDRCKAEKDELTELLQSKINV